MTRSCRTKGERTVTDGVLPAFWSVLSFLVAQFFASPTVGAVERTLENDTLQPMARRPFPSSRPTRPTNVETSPYHPPLGDHRAFRR